MEYLAVASTLVGGAVFVCDPVENDRRRLLSVTHRQQRPLEDEGTIATD
jgi:heme exporter protein D